MSKKDIIECAGVVVECLPAAQFKVQLDEVDKIIDGYISGKMRKNQIRILVGDRVNIEMSTYDLTKGRITFRQK